jgi:hypothetical protein
LSGVKVIIQSIVFVDLVSLTQKFIPLSTKPQMTTPYSLVNGPASQDELNHLAAALGRLYVSSDTTQNRERTSPVFIGGFNLAEIPSDSKMDLPLGSQTIATQVPEQSLTMKYALQPDDDQSVAAPSPPVTPQKPLRRRAQSRPNAIAGSPSSAKISSHSVTPVKLALSTGSSPDRTSSPSHRTDVVQCSGITKAQKLCTRMVKINYPLGGTSDKIERFCYQHTKEILKPTGYYPCQNSNWVDFHRNILLFLISTIPLTLVFSSLDTYIFGRIHASNLTNGDGEGEIRTR